MKTVLITGFGPFPGVSDNPTAALAQQLDGRTFGDVRIVGKVLPVSYRRAPRMTLAAAAAHKAHAILGLGVSGRATEARVESTAHWLPEGRVDVDGQTLTLLNGPAQVRASWPALAGLLGLGMSDDAGTYVCNAWLYQVASQAKVPVSFVHVPPGGLDVEALGHAVGAAA